MNRIIQPGATLGVLGSGQLGRMFAIAAGRRSVVAPSGRPQMARTCCSNWLVMQASKVR